MVETGSDFLSGDLISASLGGVFKMRSAAVLGRSRALSTGGFRRFLTASPFGDLLRPRTGALRSDDLPILKTPPRKPSVRAGFPRGRGKLRPGRARSPSPRRRREKSFSTSRKIGLDSKS